MNFGSHPYELLDIRSEGIFITPVMKGHRISPGHNPLGSPDTTLISKMTTHSSVITGSHSEGLPNDSFVNTKRGKDKGRTKHTLILEKPSLSEIIAKSQNLNLNSITALNQNNSNLSSAGPPAPSSDVNSDLQLHQPSLAPEGTDSTFTPPSVLDGNLKDLASVTKAINSLQNMIVENHIRLECKLDSRLTQINEQIVNLGMKPERQDLAFSRLRTKNRSKNRQGRN